MTALLDRILREAAETDLLTALAERLAPTDLQSLLLEVYRRRAAVQSPAALLAAYERNPFVRPSPVGPATMLELDRLALSLATPPFEPVELAPVCPLGTASTVASVDQNKAVVTVRNTEVVADSTNVLALECAARRRVHRRTPGEAARQVDLCATHRLLRPQSFTGPGMFAHFRVFALCSAGRDLGAHRFELDTLARHVTFYLRFFAAAAREGYPLSAVRVAITDLTGGTMHDALEAGVMAPLRDRFPDTRLAFDPDRTGGRNYYDGLCFAVYAVDPAGAEQLLVDGGCTTWTQQLLSDQKERLVISGVRTERLCAVFPAAQ